MLGKDPGSSLASSAPRPAGPIVESLGARVGGRSAMLRSLWQHVQLHEGQEAKSSPAAHCIHCGHRYAANTTRILAHMTGYGGQVQKCSQLRLLSEEERAELAELVACKKEKRAAREKSRGSRGQVVATAVALPLAATGGISNADASVAAEIVAAAVTSTSSPAATVNGCRSVGGSSSSNSSPSDGRGTLAPDVQHATDGCNVVPVAGRALDSRGHVVPATRVSLLGPATVRAARKRPRHPPVQEEAKQHDGLLLDRLQGHVSELDGVTKSLVEAAIRVKQNAYCPYSTRRVGAAVMSPDGRVFTGCNMENASYGLSLCAERVAVTAAIAAGVRKFVAVAISRDVEGQPEGVLCGACWQTLIEFGSDWDAYSVTPEGLYTRLPARYVLPLARALDAAPRKRRP